MRNVRIRPSESGTREHDFSVEKFSRLGTEGVALPSTRERTTDPFVEMMVRASSARTSFMIGWSAR